MVYITREYDDSVILENLRQQRGLVVGDGAFSGLEISPPDNLQSVKVEVTLTYSVPKSEADAFFGDAIVPPPPA